MWYAGLGTQRTDVHLRSATSRDSPSYMLGRPWPTEHRNLGWARHRPPMTPARSIGGGRFWSSALALVVWRLYVFVGLPPGLLGTAVLLLGFWFLTALNTSPLAPASAGRYQYLGIVLMALVASELAAGLRVSAMPLSSSSFAGLGRGDPERRPAAQRRPWARDIAQQDGEAPALSSWPGSGDPQLRAHPAELRSRLSQRFSMPDPLSPRSTPTAPRLLPGRARHRAAAPPGLRRHGLGRRPRDPPGPGGGGPALPSAPSGSGTTFPVPPRAIVLTASRPGTQVSLRRYASARSRFRSEPWHRGRPSCFSSHRPLASTLVARLTGGGRSPPVGTPSLTAGELLTPRNARILLGLGLVASGALLLAWQSHLTFLIDDWDLLLSRRGFNAHALFDPHARHLILGPALVYKAIQATIGMDSIVPYAVAAIAASSPASSCSSST